MATSFQAVITTSQGNVHVDRHLREQTLKNRNSRSDLHVTKLPLTMTRRDEPAGQAKVSVMSNNENLEKAGFYAKTAEPRITGPLPHGSLTYTQQVQTLQEPGAWSRREKVRYCAVLREVMITIGGVAAAKILSSRLFWRA
ncbi:hypothetical protein LB506_008738 [Fusarium annulatum]|nr:hypothetical protein LB506_008738 [Fusarium annulatum]